MGVCVCVCACVRACVRACVCVARARACMSACVPVSVHLCLCFLNIFLCKKSCKRFGPSRFRRLFIFVIIIEQTGIYRHYHAPWKYEVVSLNL